MSPRRIHAILLQEVFITRHSFEIAMDLPFFSVVSILVFGFVAVYLSAAVSPTAARYLLLGMVLWEIVRVAEYSMALAGLWNIWSRNLSNLFIAPLSTAEYLVAQMLSGIVKALGIFLLVSLVAWAVFGFNVFVVGLANLALSFLNLSLFSWSIGIFAMGLIFWWGTRIQALAWSIVFLFQPLTAAYFPVEVLPPPLQTVAYLLPPTHVFEAGRAALADPAIQWRAHGLSLLENAAYFGLALLAFQAMFRRSRQTGQFARNEN